MSLSTVASTVANQLGSLATQHAAMATQLNNLAAQHTALEKSLRDAVVLAAGETPLQVLQDAVARLEPGKVAPPASASPSTPHAP